MVEFEITEAIAQTVADRFDTYNDNIEVIDVERDDGQWDVIFWNPRFVDTDPLGPSKLHHQRRDRMAVETLLDMSEYARDVYAETDTA